MANADRLAVVTGASSGIGAATAELLAGAGWRVVAVARTREKLETLCQGMRGRGFAEALDASDGDAVLEMADRVLKQHGVPNAVINSAGAGEWKFIEDTPPDEALVMMQAPFFAAYNVTHAFMPGMLERGSGVFVHVGSPASTLPWPGATGYAAARWALRGLNESLHQDLAGTGVRSSHVVFGKVSSAYFDHNPGAEEMIPRVGKTVRTISPQECAKVIVRVIERPRREVFYPFVMRLYHWTHSVAPWLTRWLVRRTSPVRRK